MPNLQNNHINKVVLSSFSTPDMSTDVNRNYSFNDIIDRIYSEATPIQPDHSSQGPPRADTTTTINEGIGVYDSIDNQQKPNTPQAAAGQAIPSPVRDEASKKGDGFNDTEEHTYAVVNKKKRLEDGEGERGELGGEERHYDS